MHEKIVAAINCSIPFIPKQFREGVQICTNSDLGKKGIDIYKSSPIELTNLWSGESFVLPPCQYYHFETKSRAQVRGDNASFHSGVKRYNWKGSMKLSLNINSKMRVTQQVWSYKLLSFIAETGGFVGLFLGFTILDIRVVMELLIRKLSLYDKTN